MDIWQYGQLDMACSLINWKGFCGAIDKGKALSRQRSCCVCIGSVAKKTWSPFNLIGRNGSTGRSAMVREGVLQ